jgi:hypothetical protein
MPEATTTTATTSAAPAAAPAATPATAPAAAPTAAAPAAPSLAVESNLIGDAKPTEGTEATDGGEAKAPEPVAYDLKLPEGIEVDKAQLDAFTALLGENKVAPEVAQKLADLHIAAVKQIAEAPYQQWKDMQVTWQNEIKADPDFGGAKLESETLPAIANALRVFSPTPEAEAALRKAFSFTGAGNNPEIVRFVARIGKAVSEGSHVPAGGPTAESQKSPAEKLYPSQAAKAA